MSEQQQDNSLANGGLTQRKRLIGRRSMVRLGWIAGGLIFLGGQLWIILKLFFSATSPYDVEGPIDLGPVDQFAVGSVTHFWKQRFLLVRHTTGFLALSQECTHDGKCKVDYLPEHRVIFCPCHGARFSLTGAVLTGPAPRPLERFVTSVHHGQVMVDTSRRLPPRSSY